MQTNSDARLLRAYAVHGVDAAFAELVQRHTNLVYSAALRQVESPDVAADIAQKVFISLARGAETLAPKLSADASLAGWLCRSARNLSLNHRRDEFRRLNRERHAMEQITSTSGDAPDWEKLSRVLDEAMSELAEVDYDALVLRFHQNQDFRAVGAALDISDDAAQKRVSRAVEKLREIFSKKKITVGAGWLTVLISANAVQAAPVGLAATISAAAVAGTAAATSTTIATTKIIAMTTLQKTLVAVAVAALAGAGIFEARQNSKLRDQVQTLQQRQAPLADQIQLWQNNFAEATNRLAGLLAENSRLKSNPNLNELLKLRGEVTQLRGGKNDPNAVVARDWLARAGQLKQWVQQNPTAAIPEFQYLTEQDWLNVAKGSLKTNNDFRRTASVLRWTAEDKFATMLVMAVQGYRQANNGQFPTALSQLQSYFISPVNEATLQRWEIAPAATFPYIGVDSPLVITENAAVDELLDTRFFIDSSHSLGANWIESQFHEALQAVRNTFAQANPTANSDNYSQLLPYATTPEQQAAVQKLIELQQLREAP
jgi:RNA polymerase sigma factor (sigma-70 family)